MVAIKRLDLRDQFPKSREEFRSLMPRNSFDVSQAMAQVTPIIDQVRVDGAKALAEFSLAFDRVVPKHFRVPTEIIDRALGSLEPNVRYAIEEAIRRARIVHQDQIRAGHETQVGPGARVSEKWIPVDRVGLYVPGGVAVYPSSVMMNVVPAQIAGVKSIAVASPPQIDHDGYPHPTILATCALLGVSEVYAVGGAQAIAMFAYGADLGDDGFCESVDLVTGPGNVYVAAAKRALRGIIGIDSEAGPTEIMILADRSANADFVAADLISQAEHDVLAAAVLVTDSLELADQVEKCLEERTRFTKHGDRIQISLSGPQSRIILVRDIAQGIDVVNAYAAEHLEIHTTNARADAELVRNAGAVFIGPFSPVSLGDYAAGSNHVLPTGGCACHSSGLSVHTFLKAVHLIDYSELALNEIASTVVTLARAEDLPAHGEAILARTGDDLL